MADHTEFLGRKNPAGRFVTASKFDRRLKSHNRPVPVREEVLPEDSPKEEFISKTRITQD